MNFEYFIARRIAAHKDYKSSISAPIIKIAILAISLGMITMLISVATSVGLQKKIKEKVSAFNGDLIITNFDTNNSDDSQVPISMQQDFYPNFTISDNVSHIQITASKGAVIRTQTDFEGVIVKGVGPDYNWSYFEDFLTQGVLPTYTTPQMSNQVLISEYLANRLGLKVGDKALAYFFNKNSSTPPRTRAFTISGLYNSGFQQFDAQFIIGDIRHIQRLNKWEPDQIGAFELFVKDFDFIEQTNNEVYDAIGSMLDTQTIRNRFYAIFEWLELFDFNVILIIVMMIIVAGFNMITALLVLILERTKMIGILKALGSDNWSVRKIFIYNAMYLVGVGLFWGNIIGIGLLLLQQHFDLFALDPNTYYVSQVPVYLHWSYIVALNVGTLLLCFLILLIPSYIISKISPVKAIRFE
ncbi:FtsX-like permease family protein [Flavobacteriaceae bacterium]|jgi:lipoprotein-releasing system permease protein|nr:FtsX-like permease family protein [Flavobacteriaceae bacterium]MDA9309966.1 FtsX-like permease family protein [Flavobacteriaceae bacterium]MDB3934704.1 FtsX-like permease family protein [Flavobacteriaceae bacterium]MDB4114286.1 FtsX-like permease family protein [Flavobacteriaceae bacterium]MDC0098629.1 FtsX-like permease family protein [Flavobacteriaceae bacterium]